MLRSIGIDMINLKTVLAVFLFFGLCRQAGALDDAAYDPKLEKAEKKFFDAENPVLKEDLTPEMGVSTSYASETVVRIYDFSRPDRFLKDVDLFADGKRLGKSPVTLERFVVNTSGLSFSAYKSGYRELKIKNMVFPRAGEMRLAIVKKNPASFYTTPAFVIGLGLITGSFIAYAQKSEESSLAGVSLLSGGLGLIGFTQVIARFAHIPFIEKKARQANEKAASAGDL